MIYCITNTKNGKFYIGRTMNPVGNRWSAHIKASERGSMYPIHVALREDGLENFSFTILDSSKMTDVQLRERENYFIRKTNAYVLGYNVAPVGRNPITPLVVRPELESNSSLDTIASYYAAPYIQSAAH